MEEENLSKIEKNTQKILKKLISEERIACDFYRGCISSVKRNKQLGIHMDCPELYMGCISSIKPIDLDFIEKKFTEIEEDEATDHLEKLIKFAYQNGLEVPFKYKDIEKNASKKAVYLFNNLKKDQNAIYYIEQAIKSEEDAIKSYEDAMKEECLYELQPILLNNYYDEIQHLEDLNLILSCVIQGVILQ